MDLIGDTKSFPTKTTQVCITVLVRKGYKTNVPTLSIEEHGNELNEGFVTSSNKIQPKQIYHDIFITASNHDILDL